MELNNDFRVSVPPPGAWKVLSDVERIAPLLPGAQLQEVEGDEYRGVVKVKVGPITAQYKGTASFVEQDEAAGHMVLKATGRDTRGQGNASATITVQMQPDGAGTKVGVVTDLTITGKVAQFGRGVLAEVSGKLIAQFVSALEADIQSGGAPSASPEKAASAEKTTRPAPAKAATAEKSAARAATAENATTPAAGQAATSEKATAADEATAADGASAVGKATTSDEATSDASAQPVEEAPVPASGPRRIDSPEPVPVDLLDAAGGSVAKRLVPVAGAVGILVVLMVLRRRRSRRRARARRYAALPDRRDLAAAQEAARRAAHQARQAALDLPDLAAAQEFGRRAAHQARRMAPELPDLAAAQDLGRRAAKRARKAAPHR